jgi:thymidine phosphorylase
MRRFFGPLPSSFSISLPSRLLPVLAPAVCLGVSGGVVTGTPVTLAEFVAVIAGTFPEINGGLLTTACGTADAWVAIDDAELDLAGDEGRCIIPDVEAGGEGAVKELVEFLC